MIWNDGRTPPKIPFFSLQIREIFRIKHFCHTTEHFPKSYVYRMKNCDNWHWQAFNRWTKIVFNSLWKWSHTQSHIEPPFRFRKRKFIVFVLFTVFRDIYPIFTHSKFQTISQYLHISSAMCVCALCVFYALFVGNALQLLLLTFHPSVSQFIIFLP